MTITTTDTVERYVGDGTQTAWPIRFPFFNGEDVKACIVNSAGEQVNLVYGTEYTVTKSTGSIGGTLNYALANDVVLTIWLSLPITQGADFYNTGPLNAETLESSFDRLTLIAQQLQEASDRSVKVATSSTETPEQLLTSLYTARDTAASSASAAATSESNALASKQAAATSETSAAASKTAAAVSAIAAETWAESETPPDPNDTESKSAKSWAMIAGDAVPIASANIAGKAKTSASWQVDSDTGVATVPTATESLAGIARQATDDEVAAGTEDGPVFMTPYDVQQKIDALATDVGVDMGDKADADSPVLSSEAYIVETYKSASGDTWYRKWSDGFIEQGGCVPPLTTVGNTYVITLVTPMLTNKYIIHVTGSPTETGANLVRTSAGVKQGTVTTTSFTCIYWGQFYEQNLYWTASGF